MINDEKKKLNLLLAYKIAELYKKLEVSTSTLSELTSVPLSTVKNSLNIVRTRKNDYLRLLPNLVDGKYFEEFQEEIEEQIYINKKTTRWDKTPVLYEQYQKEFDMITELYKKANPIISEESKKNIRMLHVNGSSIRQIAKETGYSLGSIHKIINQKLNEEKGNQR